MISFFFFYDKNDQNGISVKNLKARRMSLISEVIRVLVEYQYTKAFQ